MYLSSEWMSTGDAGASGALRLTTPPRLGYLAVYCAEMGPSCAGRSAGARHGNRRDTSNPSQHPSGG